MHNYSNLKIWKEGIDLATDIYAVTTKFPKNEQHGLVSQMTRAAVSVPSNIAEGAGRDSDKDFAHFLSIALGSMFELHSQVIIAERIGYLSAEQSGELQSKIENLQKMIVGFRKNLTANSAESAV